MGKQTRGAIAFFQSLMGLPITGQLDEATKPLLMPEKPAQPARGIDPITAERIAKLHPYIRQDVLAGVKEANAALTGRAQVRIVQGLRTFEEQAALYAQGRTKPGAIVTNAKAGTSFHNYGLGFDFALLLDGKEISWSTTTDFDQDKIADWMEVVKVFERRGFTWGGRFKSIKDYPHFEKTHGNTWQILFAKVNARKIDKDGYVLI